MKNEDVMDWQRRFAEGPKVWVVWVDGEPGNLYESPGAANFEVEWRNRHQPKVRVAAYPQPIHSLALSRERWERFDGLGVRR